jgi:hypothetical protein
MLHVRHLITQTNLGILKSNRSLLNKQTNYLLTTKTPSDNSTNSANKSASFGFEQIIRIDHTETEEQKRIRLSESCIKRLQELGDLKKYLRITVDSGGCSGFEYKFSLDNLVEGDK